MDLGIGGRSALVCASSKGLGLGCAQALATAGVDLVMNARGAEALEDSAAAIRQANGVRVTTVVADVTTQQGQAAVLEAAKDVDILVTNAGGPPPGLWTDWDREDFIRALDANMLTPIALMKALLPGMMARGWGRVVNITSQSVKAPIPALGLSNSARAGLTGYVAGTARQVAGSGVTINNLQPGIHATDRADALDEGVAELVARELTPADLARPDLRGAIAARAASRVAAMPGVRAALVDFQRAFAAREGGAVLDGRDISTVICPDADVKLFVTASAEERARRRHEELREAGSTESFESVLGAIRERDARDSSRTDAPMRCAADAHLLDTTEMSISEGVAEAVRTIEQARDRAAR